MVKVDAANTLRLLSRDRSMTSVVFGGAAARLVRVACTMLCRTTNWNIFGSRFPLWTSPSRSIHLWTGSGMIVYCSRGQRFVRCWTRVDFPAPMFPSMSMR